MRRLITTMSAMCLLLMPVVTHGQGFSNPLGMQWVIDALKSLITGIIYVGTPALAVFIVWTGFLFVAAQGSSDGLQKAKKMAITVAIGGLLLLGMWAIVTIAGGTFGALGSIGLLVIFAAGYLYVRSRR